MTNKPANTSRRGTTNNHPVHPQAHTKLLTITEAADIARAPVATLRYWRHLGIGPRSFRLGRHVVYRADELHAWINTQHDHDHPNSD
jgi:predicted DNA-binding transcriptional regulator AlpA